MKPPAPIGASADFRGLSGGVMKPPGPIGSIIKRCRRPRGRTWRRGRDWCRRARCDWRIGLSLEIREDFELCRGVENYEFFDPELRQIDALVLVRLLLQLADPVQQFVRAFRVRVSGQLVVIVAPDL